MTAGSLSDEELRAQYAGKAQDWSAREYADSSLYLRHRADLVETVGRRLQRGCEVLDLACGDGGFGAELVRRGYRYHGVDLTPEMVRAAAQRLGARARFEVGDLNTYVPPTPVAATLVFRALYYAIDREAFFRRVADFTTAKLVFDLNPRQFPAAAVCAELRAAGWTDVTLHPFFIPQTVRLRGPLKLAATALERTGPLARLALRYRFTYVVAASR